MTKDRELYLQAKQGQHEKNRELWFSRLNILRGYSMGVVYLLSVYFLAVWRWGGG